MILRAAFLSILVAHATLLHAAERWVVDPKHSDVSFTIRHLMSQVRGRFTRFTGTIIRDEPIESSSVTFEIDAASIDTAEPNRDDDLRGGNFFDVRRFPKITFRSTNIRKAGDNRYDVAGMLTMHGISRPVTLPITLLGIVPDRVGKGRKAGFETSTTIDRKEFGIDWNEKLDAGGVLLSDEVRIMISIQASESR